MLTWKSLFLYLLLDVHSCVLMNVALRKLATQISQYSYHVASTAVDGIDGELPSQGSCSHTAGLAAKPWESTPWWQVDIGQEYYIHSVAITHVNIGPPRVTHDFSIGIYGDGESPEDAVVCYYHVGAGTKGKTELYVCTEVIKGRYVRITIHGQQGKAEMLILCEVRVFGTQTTYLPSSSLRLKDVAISNLPDMVFNVQGKGECAMKCFVLPMCHIFSVTTSVSNSFQCNIFISQNPQLVGNSTGTPSTAVFAS